MSLLSTLPGTLSALISLINHAYIALVAAIWYYVVYYGLTPQYSFPVGIAANSSFMAFFNALYNSIYLTIAGALLLAGSFALMASNSLGKIQFPSSLLYRSVFAVILSFFSLQTSIFVMKIFQAIFLQVWNYGSVDWYSLLSVSNSVAQIKASYSENPFFQVMEFLLLSLYFVGTGALLAVLEIRQALAIFLVSTLPLFSLFFVIKGFDSLAVKFWKLFIEINALPFFILIILYNAHIFYGNFLLQAAFIILAASSPYLLVTASSILSSSATSLMNTGDFLGSSVSGPAGAIGKFASGSVKNSVGDVFGTAGKSGTFASRAKKTSMQDFALARDLEYNRFEVDSYEE